MKPNNYDDYGGVEHVDYCFQVCSDDLHCRSMSLRSFFWIGKLGRLGVLDFEYRHWWNVY